MLYVQGTAGSGDVVPKPCEPEGDFDKDGNVNMLNVGTMKDILYSKAVRVPLEHSDTDA